MAISKEDFVKALKELKETSPKRKFSQSVDLVINLKDLDLKKPDQQLDIWVPLEYPRGKPIKIAAFVGPELATQAKATCDTVVTQAEFKKFEGNKKAIKKLAKTNDYFIAQANIMPDVAKYFGRVLGPRGKMPNPKAGGVVPPNANLKVVTDKFKKILHVVAKIQLSAKCSIGKQDMPDDQLITNLMTVYTAVVRALPIEENNIKTVILKYSMGPPLLVGATTEEKAAKKRAPKAPAQKPEGKTEPAKEAPKPEAKAAAKGEAA